jgi:hypothetical protein
VLFSMIYKWKSPLSEDALRRTLALFESWTPPFEFKHHWALCDGSGGVAIFESADSALILEGLAPFTPYFAFHVDPVTEIEAAVPILHGVVEWRDSVS